MNIEKVVRVWRSAGAVILVLASVSCGDLAREGQAPSYLLIASMQASSGETDDFGTELRSDVLTEGSIVNDNGQAEFLLLMKDPSLTEPTSANFITIDRYHVKYIRADGRNTQGVDVPYEFDGAVTGTVTDDGLILGFTLVRHQAKVEAPLGALASNFVIVSTIAEVTFYGHDQTGRAVSVMGRISVHFANFADPE